MPPTDEDVIEDLIENDEPEKADTETPGEGEDQDKSDKSDKSDDQDNTELDLVKTLGIEDDDNAETVEVDDVVNEDKEEKVEEGPSLVEKLASEMDDITENAGEDVDLDTWDDLSREEQDEEIYLAMKDDETWASWMDTAEEEGVEGVREFAVMAAREGVKPNDLSSRGIYNIKGFLEKISSEEAKTSDDAIILSNPNDPEAVAEFLETNFRIPKDVEGYDSKAAFQGTIFEEDEEARTALLETAAQRRWSQNQLAEEAADRTIQHEEMDRRRIIEKNEYVSTQHELLKKIYGDNADEITKAAIQAMRSSSFGKEFIQEFKGEKVLSAAKLIAMVYDITHHKAGSKELNLLANAGTEAQTIENIDLRGHKSKILLAQREKLENNEYASMDNVGDDPSSLEKYYRIWGAINKINEELARRRK